MINGDLMQIEEPKDSLEDTTKSLNTAKSDIQKSENQVDLYHKSKNRREKEDVRRNEPDPVASLIKKNAYTPKTVI